jgi:ribosomal protein S12 methylthiotransferase
VSLGCPKNLVDSEHMLGTLREAGCTLVSEDAPADAIVINTCGFLEASKEESLEVIRDAIARRERGEVGRVVVAGCLVQRHRAKLLDWVPGIDSMIGVFDRDQVTEAVLGLREARVEGDAVPADDVFPRYWIAANALQAAKTRGMKTTGLTVNGADAKGIGYFEDDSLRFRLTPKHWAYLRVSEGCNQRCAFCTIPSIRGKMRSKPLDAILREARMLFDDGAYELNLIGQDTTSYGYDIYGRHKGAETRGHGDRSLNSLPLSEGERQGGRARAHDFARLHPRPGPLPGREAERSGDLIELLTSLDALASQYGGRWIRLMYVYPTHFTDAMIDAIAGLPNIVKYIDIPLQHISDRMLKSMRRNITRGRQEELLNKLRERIPGLAIRTTFITGFPGERDEDHEELLEFIQDFQFDMMGVFQYSREEGTPAGTMDLDPALHVPAEVKAERERELMLAQQEIAFSNAQYLAETRSQFDILVEKADVGRSYFQAPQVDSVTHIQGQRALSPGEFVRCTVIDSDGYDLVATPTSELSATR